MTYQKTVSIEGKINGKPTRIPLYIYNPKRTRIKEQAKGTHYKRVKVTSVPGLEPIFMSKIQFLKR